MASDMKGQMAVGVNLIPWRGGGWLINWKIWKRPQLEAASHALEQKWFPQIACCPGCVGVCQQPEYILPETCLL